MPGTVSVVIPAHNEATVIAGTLRRLIDTDPEGRLQLVVAANGCTDETAAVAAAVSPRVRVIEVTEASKIAALNAGDDVATAFPRAYLDADVWVSAEALLAVADALIDSTALAGAPRLEVDTTGASLLVRWRSRIWALSDYRNAAMIGSGVYILTEDGRSRFGRFPDVIADDRYVLRLFAREVRMTVVDQVFTVPAPRTLRAFTRRRRASSLATRRSPTATPNCTTRNWPAALARSSPALPADPRCGCPQFSTSGFGSSPVGRLHACAATGPHRPGIHRTGPRAYSDTDRED